MVRKLRGQGQVTLMDLTDSLSIIAYISSDNQRQILYNPNDDTYTPDLKENPMTLSVEVYVTGQGTNDQSDLISNVRWSYQHKSQTEYIPIEVSDDVHTLDGKDLIIKDNVLTDAFSRTYRIDFDFPGGGEMTHVTADFEMVKVELGTDGTDGEDAVALVVTLPQGDAIQNHEGTLSATANLYEGSKPVTTTSYSWQTLTGSSWSNLSGTSSTRNFNADEIHSLGVFKAVVVYKGTTYEQTFTLRDITDPYQISIIGADVFKNGQGFTDLTAKVYQNGDEVDTGGTQFQYTWSAYRNNGNVITSFSESGKNIRVQASEVESITNVQVLVEDMSGIIGIGNLTLTDLNDAKFSTTPPRNPEPGDLWVNNSTTPAIIKVYESGRWENANIDVEQLDPDLAETIEFVTGTLGNIADDNKLTFADRQIVLNNISTIIGSLPSSSSSVQSTLPTYLTLDAGGSGTFSRYRQTAREVGVETNSSVYRNVQNTYTSLASYLQGFNPRPWDVTNGNKNAVTNLDSGNTFRQKFLDYYLAELALVEETEVLAKQLAEEYTDANVSDTVHEETEWQYPLTTDKAHENGGVELDIEGNKDGVVSTWNDLSGSKWQTLKGYSWNALIGPEIVVVSNRGGRNLLGNSEERTLTPKNSGLSSDNFNYETLIYPTVNGKEYTISADVEVTHGSASHITVYANYSNSNPSTLDVPITKGKIKRTYTAYDTIDNNRVLLYAGKSGSTRGTGVIFRNIKIEEGEVENPTYSQAPEDVDHDELGDGVYKTKLKLDEPLRGNDSAKDTIENGTDGKYYIHRRVNSANETLSTPTVEPVSDEVQGKLDRIPTFAPSTHIYTLTTPTPRFRAKFKSRMWAEEQRRKLDNGGVTNQFNASDFISAGTKSGGRVEVELPQLISGNQYVISTNAPEESEVKFTTPEGTYDIYLGNSKNFIAEEGVIYMVSIPEDQLNNFTGVDENNPGFIGGDYVIQVERGQYPTDPRPSNLDEETREENKREESENKVLTVYDTQLRETEKEIQGYVSETIYGVESEDGVPDENSVMYQVQSLVSQSAENFTIGFNELDRQIFGEDENDENSINYKLEEVRNNFIFHNDGTFEISSPGSNASMELTKDALIFWNGDTNVASVTSNELRINKGVFTESLTVHSYNFSMRGDYGVWSYKPR